jgi:hypothetical protein
MARVVGKVLTATKIYFDSTYFNPTLAGTGGAFSGDMDDIPDGTTYVKTHLDLTTTKEATWNGKQAALGFTPENVANKQGDLTSSATNYPTVDAVISGLSTKAPSRGYLEVVSDIGGVVTTETDYLVLINMPKEDSATITFDTTNLDAITEAIVRVQNIGGLGAEITLDFGDALNGSESNIVLTEADNGTAFTFGFNGQYWYQGL